MTNLKEIIKLKRLMKTEMIILDENQQERMTSLEIAEVIGKPHNDIMKAIRKMEPAWEKVSQGKFSLTSRTIVQPNGGTREYPCYVLTKTECLYIATKFNDEARAKLVLRWQELEMQHMTQMLQQHMRLLRATKMFVRGVSAWGAGTSGASWPSSWERGRGFARPRPC